MEKKLYQGSCHCGRVKFEAELNLAEGTMKCNCTRCWKKRAWTAWASADGFRILQGADELSAYKAGHVKGHGGFCKHCGVEVFNWVQAAEWNDGEYVSISIAAIDDLEAATLLAAPVQYCDGRADNWWRDQRL